MSASEIGQRVAVVGNTGSGKSTLAARLGALLDVPHVELDALFWGPEWTPVELDRFRARVTEAVARERWTMSGNYLGASQDISWPRADTVIWLDPPLRIVLWRVLRRSWLRWRRRELLWGTNYESFGRQLKLWDADESLLAFAVQQHRAKRRAYTEAMTDPRWAHIRFHRVRSPREVERLLEAVTATVAT